MAKMKYFRILLFLFALTMIIGTSCKKYTIGQVQYNSGVLRKIQYSLYTDKDFSSDDDNITFMLFIQNSGNETLWDSLLSPMQLKDIPRLPNKLNVEKLVPDNNSSLLKVGFRYRIENIGSSLYIDSSSAGETFKIVNFNFH